MLLKKRSELPEKKSGLFFRVSKGSNCGLIAEVCFDLPARNEQENPSFVEIRITPNYEATVNLLRQLAQLVGHTDFHLLHRVSKMFTLGLRGESYPNRNAETDSFWATMTLGVGENALKSEETTFEQCCEWLYWLARQARSGL